MFVDSGTTNNIAEKVFDEILRQCMGKGLVGGQVLYTDSTHIKAKANKHKKRQQITVDGMPASYMAELDAQIALDRKVLGRKTFDPQGRRLYAWRKGTIERSFAESKENHGLRTARMLGLPNRREQSFLTQRFRTWKRLAKDFFFPMLLLMCSPLQTATLRLHRKVAVC